MNPRKKSILVRFFEVKADSRFVQKFVGSFRALRRLKKGTDVVSTVSGRYIIHCFNPSDSSIGDREMFCWSSVKERNTWQVRATQDGRIQGLEDSNSIIGDISFYMFDPAQKVIAAFTTYSSTDYLKSMCTSILKRLVSESAIFSVDYLSDDIGISEVRDWDYYSRMSIKLDTEKIEFGDDLPELVKALLNIKDTFGSNEISVTVGGGHVNLPKQDVTETINYLSSSEGCSSLLLVGGKRNEEERSLPINLRKAFVKYRTSMELKIDQKYIDFGQANAILSGAFASTRFNSSM